MKRVFTSFQKRYSFRRKWWCEHHHRSTAEFIVFQCMRIVLRRDGHHQKAWIGAARVWQWFHSIRSVMADTEAEVNHFISMTCRPLTKKYRHSNLGDTGNGGIISSHALRLIVVIYEAHLSISSYHAGPQISTSCRYRMYSWGTSGVMAVNIDNRWNIANERCQVSIPFALSKKAITEMLLSDTAWWRDEAACVISTAVIIQKIDVILYSSEHYWRYHRCHRNQANQKWKRPKRQARLDYRPWCAMSIEWFQIYAMRGWNETASSSDIVIEAYRWKAVAGHYRRRNIAMLAYKMILPSSERQCPTCCGLAWILPWNTAVILKCGTPAQGSAASFNSIYRQAEAKWEWRDMKSRTASAMIAYWRITIIVDFTAWHGRFIYREIEMAQK